MSFPIVGIGASAGGLESFSELIARVPASTGMAWMFVQHLDPRHESLLVNLLSTRAAFPVEEAREGVKILPNPLYLITPNTAMTIGDKVLNLRSRDPSERPHRPVDRLFHSLAEQRGSNVIGIILSGCGADGAKRIRAIKQAGGITFAQGENSALFFGMPNAALQNGLRRFYSSSWEIAQELIRLSRHNNVAKD